jgi:predicted nucleotidyltransferase
VNSTHADLPHRRLPGQKATGFDMDETELLQTLTRVVSTLNDTGIRFAVAGGCAVYARGGPPSDHDVDIFLKEEDAESALRALEAAGMTRVVPPEDWLVKVYDGEVLVDLVFRPNYQPVTDELFERATWMRVGPTAALVISATDLMVDKLLVLDAHRCDFVPLLRIARDLREQVDWQEVELSAGESPYARAFLALLGDLHISDGTGSGHHSPPATEESA